MHRVIAGCNLWALLFLGAAFVLGARHSPWHQSFGIFAAVFAMLAQSAIFALFMGASKLLKEHVELYRLGPEHVARVNRILLPLFTRASLVSGLLLVMAILAGLGSSADVPVLAHAIGGALAVIALGVALPHEVRGMAAMHDALLAMEAALPDPVAAGLPVAAPPATPPSPQQDLRARALFYVGSTVLAMLLGYRYIAGISLPLAAAVIVAGLSLLCLLLSAWFAWRPAR